MRPPWRIPNTGPTFANRAVPAPARALPVLATSLLLAGPMVVEGQEGAPATDTVTVAFNLASDRDRAVRLARDGEFEPALAILRRLVALDPGNAPLRGDLAAVLAWSGQGAAALDLLESLPLPALDPMVLESVAGAALDEREYGRAISLYRAALNQEPGRPESEVGLSLALLESGDLPGAMERIPVLRAAPLDGLADSRLVAGHILAAHEQWLDAAVEYRMAEELRPHWMDAVEGELRSLREAGADVLAVRRAAPVSPEIPQEFRHDLTAGWVARQVEWTPAPAPLPGAEARMSRSHKALDQATAHRDRVADEVSGDMAHFPLRRLDFDRLVALRNAGRMDSIRIDGARLEESGIELPPYVVRVLADAALEAGDHDRAIALYRATLAEWPGQQEATLGLFWSLIGAWAFREADEVLEAALDHQPRQRWGEELREPLPNPDRLGLELARHLGWALGGEPGRAQEGLEHLHFQAPLHLDIRQELAAVYGWRGWPRRAEALHQRTGALDPEHVPSRIARLSLALDLGDRPTARALADTLVVLAPEAETVERALRRLHVDGLWEFSTRVGGARSTGGAFGTRDRSLDTRLTSPPLGDHVRAVVRAQRRDADFPEGRGIHDRVGAGLEVRARPVTLHLEANAQRADLERRGVSVSTRLPLGDRWALSAAAHSYAEDVPLRARLQGIRGRNAQGSLERRSHEGRRLVAEFDYLDLSDGNIRRSGYVAAEQQVIRRPRHRWAGLVEAYGSRSRLEAPPYFSPTHLWSATGTLLWDWTLHRFRDRSYAQRVALTGGVVDQAGQRRRPTATFTVEHRWEASDRFDLLAGIHGGLPVYDGVRERRTSVHLGLTWRLP
ncbi:MAG: poly-beta-1,6 N-acetyl-D-glucosamine export porin PgaA [Gemmatimonadales bacterium]|nr:MAG: poly-beta-1,6 N-acetyl-D-glucosamine export porin PgaA [Gemmatimonadales bacterium]